MLSIFDNKDPEPQPERKLTLTRLQSVLAAAVPASTAEQPAQLVEQSPAGRSEPVTVSPQVPERRSFSSKLQEAAPAGSLSSEGVAIPPELNEFAEQFTRSFREVLVNTVRDIQAPLNEEQRKVDSLNDSLNRTIREVEALSSDLANLAQRVDTFSKSLLELASRVSKIDDSLNIATAAVHAVQETQQAMEKRLELQAGVIRSLNSALQAREDRLDKLVATLQALRTGEAERPALKKLPDQL